MDESEVRYLVGNILRGFFSFTALDDDDAWSKGGAIFTAHYPTEGGRHVQLLKVVRSGDTLPSSAYPDVPDHYRTLL